MSFVSIEFIIFFAIIFATYYILPKQYRYIMLAIASYGFYLLWDIKYTLLLLAITLVTYFGAFLVQTKYKKVGVCVISVCIAGILLFFKFGNSWVHGIIIVLSKIGFEFTEKEFRIVIPLGLSFYTLQSLGYLIDVYRGKISAERNFLKHSLFVSFFLTIVSGPIERTDNLFKQIQKGTDFSYDKAKKGLLLIIYGYFQKIMIADRIAPLVNCAFSNYEGQTGAALLWAVVLYGVQIYVDFAGYSNIAVGAGKLLGFDLIENFKQPYFACSIKDFWKRWHISLSTWLRDYVYISLGGNRCGKVRMYRNLMITFLVSAIWHGIGINYIIWGCLHGAYQVAGSITQKYRVRLKEALRINENCFSYRLFQGLITFGLVDFAWLFFGASSTSSALRILKKILVEFQLGNTISWKGYLLGMQEMRFIILIIGIIVVLLVDILHEKRISIIEWLNKQNLLFRWSVYFIIVINLLIGIVYNYGTETSSFIYTRF